MNDYDRIELHIRRARLERSVALGDFIGNALAAVWTAMNSLGQRTSAHLRSLGHSHAKRAKAPAAFV